MNRKLNVGFLGASQILRNQHMGAVQAASNACAYGIASRRASKAAEWATEFGLPRAYSSYEEMLADPAIDVVVNTLPMTLHAEWVCKASAAGKHTLCEKPMALSVDEAEAILREAQRCKVLVMEGFTPWFSPHMAPLRRLIEAGEIGDIRIAKAEVIYTTENWQGDSRANVKLGGCVTVEAGCYCAHALRFFMGGEPQALQGFACRRPDKGPGEGLETSFVGIMQFSGGRLAMMSTSMETSFRASAEIIGTTGRIEIPDLFAGGVARVIDGSAGRGAREIDYGKNNRFQAQIEHFCDCVLHGHPLRIPLEDSLRTTRLLEALVRSSREHGTSQPMGFLAL
jgi:D-xylose 1-dehydrogenase (NADP+, D-xylono-1,5-lactone-forming)